MSNTMIVKEIGWQFQELQGVVASIHLDDLKQQRIGGTRHRDEQRLAEEYRKMSEIMDALIAVLDSTLNQPDEELWAFSEIFDDTAEAARLQLTHLPGADELGEKCKILVRKFDKLQEKVSRAWTNKLPKLLEPETEPDYTLFRNARPFSLEEFQK